MDNNKKFKPTPLWMAENYNKLNKELFGGELGQCILRPFTTGKGSQGGTLGWFKITAKGVKIERSSRRMFVESWYGNRDYADYDNFYDLCKPCIELNANYSWTEDAMQATLAHEMCHYYTYMKGRAPKQGHGPEFYAIGRVVSARSNGKFTIQRLASAEQMSNMELDPEIQAKRNKRLENKKGKLSAIFVYNTVGTAELSMTSSENVIKQIIGCSTQEPRWKQAERGLANKIIKCNDLSFLDILFDAGYKKNMRSYRYWDDSKVQNLAKQVFNYNCEVLYDKGKGQVEQPKEEPKPIEKKPKRYFVLKLQGGGLFKTQGEVMASLIKALKERFPKMPDENIRKLINNPANYVMEENRKSIGTIITETLNEFFEKEFGDNDSIPIDPDMNLGLESPFEAVGENMENNVLAVSKYYKISNLAHAVKTGDEQAIQKAGELMSKLVHQSGCIFVPIPSHTGESTYTLEIAKIIANNTHGYVSNILGGKQRETLYQQKLNGINASSVDLGMSLQSLDYPAEMIANRDIYLVDNVVSTGETYKQAIQALINLTGISPKILVLGYVDDETIQKKNYKPIQHSLSMSPSFMESKKQAILKNLLSEAEWNFHHGKNHDMTPYGSENKYVCYHETGQFGSGTYFSTFNTNYERNDDMKTYVDDSPNDNPNFIKVGDGVYRVDFDLYKNLYRVYSEKQGDILHTMCSYLNAFYHAVSGWGLGHYHPKQADFTNSRFYQIIRYNSDSLGLKCPSYLQLTRMAQKHAQSEEKQSFSTVFMEWNGFNGVNVSGVGKFDNTRHGSVIYDLSKTSLEPVETGKKGWFHNIGGYHTNTIATKSWDWKDTTMVDSLQGKFNSLGWDGLDDKSKLRVLKNIFNSGNSYLDEDEISLLLYRLRDNQKLQSYVCRQLFNPQKVDSDIVLDGDVKKEIIKAKQYYFVNYTTPENYHGWRSNDFFEEFLSNYKWSNWDATNEDLKAFLNMLMGYLKRPLTDDEKQYIKEDYFEEEENNNINESILNGDNIQYVKNTYQVYADEINEIYRQYAKYANLDEKSEKICWLCKVCISALLRLKKRYNVNDVRTYHSCLKKIYQLHGITNGGHTDAEISVLDNSKDNIVKSYIALQNSGLQLVDYLKQKAQKYYQNQYSQYVVVDANIAHVPIYCEKLEVALKQFDVVETNRIKPNPDGKLAAMDYTQPYLMDIRNINNGQIKILKHANRF